MRNRLAVLLPLLLLLGLLALATGCKRTDLTATGPGTEASSETAQILSALQKYQEATGNDLRNLVSEIKRQQSAQAEKAGDPPVARELKVSMSALDGAKQALEAKDAQVMATALGRLDRVVLALSAEIPAAVIGQHVDRALYVMDQQEAQASREFMVASLSLLAASEAAVNGRPPALVPDVLKDLEAAKSSLDAGNAPEARKALAVVVQAVTTHPSVLVLSRARLAIAGAREALARQAWPVVEAELKELEGRLKEVGSDILPPPAKPAADLKQPAATTPETPAAIKPAAEPSAAPAATPAATPSAPAASSTAAPSATPSAPPAATPAPATPPATPAPSAAPASSAPATAPAAPAPAARRWPWQKRQ